MWKISQFTVVHDLACRGRPGLLLVLNTATQRSMVVAEPTWAAAAGSAACPDSAEPSTRTVIAALADAGYLVAEALDENAGFLDGFDRRRLAPARINPIIAFTTDCNIACTYCYEEGVRATTMTEPVVAATVRWLERRIVLDGVIEVVPNLFGGEPLLHRRLLTDFMTRVNAMGDAHSATVAYAMSSNGMLLTEELARVLAQLRLRQIQISLDGPPAVHDQRRVGHRGQSTFAQALRGIEHACRWIPDVTVKVNFDRHNAAAVPDLFDELAARGTAERLTVKLEAIAHQFPGSKACHPSSYVIPPETPEMADTYLGLTQAARRRGLRVTPDTAHTTPCMYTSQWGVIIGPDGGISKCISLVGRPEHEVGNVLAGDWDTDRYDAAMNVRKKVTDCVSEKCAYLPVCAGGCSYESAVRGMSTATRFCTKPALERYHFGRQLLRHEARLTELGVTPLGDPDFSLPVAPAPGRAPTPVLLPMPTRRDSAT
ncbi:radical SAM/SPASM domain-containing protein [Catellatospora chokoriensis]|uniref:Radical SAM/SPASM domain-containing protein n=1 Tax=Catellatospora chokoriensis TaxID=310353 RepID=A0A8J3JZV0_9ACTN|nr:radical SAM protein [Catellatospora chokoriensis]GIF94146.1 radical SAM/SPASM domain-containing protein [Catellatospora chokoriensis]